MLGFNGIDDSVLQFFASILYSFVMFVIVGISKPILRFAGSEMTSYVQMLMPMQFFKEYFSTLFFVSLDVYTWLFWGMLVPQMIFNFVENVYGLGSASRKVKAWVYNVLGDKPKKAATLTRRTEFHELILERSKLKEKVQSTLQDFIGNFYKII